MGRNVMQGQIRFVRDEDTETQVFLATSRCAVDICFKAQVCDARNDE